MGLTPSVELSANVICKEYAYGLHHSRELVRSILKDASCPTDSVDASYYHDIDPPYTRHWLRFKLRRWRLRREMHRRKPQDFNLFLEKIYPFFYPFARRQILIPNQEWFFDFDRSHLERIDLVICKTRHAEDIFKRFGCRTAYSSFTSPDHRLAGAVPMRREFLCLTGRFVYMRDRILALWNRHPEWPQLTITSQNAMPKTEAANIRKIEHFMPEEMVMQMQNEHRFHLCMTKAEGFGHKLNEGLSCGAIVIAIDGEPMNEVVTPERGMLVKSEKSKPMGVGIAYDFDEKDLERTIEKCVRLSDGEIETMSGNARKWFEENDRFFRERFPGIVREA